MEPGTVNTSPLPDLVCQATVKKNILKKDGDLAPIVCEKAASYVAHLKRLKKVFDPNNIMNPGNLCF
ncbi:MAG: FAD-linked oxidase C-terminal domain-containing protein [Desulfobacteraceae bacterium]